MKAFRGRGLLLVVFSLAVASQESVVDDPVAECAALVKEHRFTLALGACQKALGTKVGTGQNHCGAGGVNASDRRYFQLMFDLAEAQDNTGRYALALGTINRLLNEVKVPSQADQVPS